MRLQKYVLKTENLSGGLAAHPPTPVPGFSEAPTSFPLEPGEVAANPFVTAVDDM